MKRPLALVNSQRDLAESGIRWLCKSTAKQIAIEYCLSGRWLLAIDGFMGSGKSTLAKLLAVELGCAVISLDQMLPDVPIADPTLTYVERLSKQRLASAIADLRMAGAGVIEGVCLRDVIYRHNITAGDVFSVYSASVAVPAADVLWHESAFFELDELPEDPLYREIVVYHRRWAPHSDSDAIVIRSDDDEMHHFTAPDGQRFTVPAFLWKFAGIGSWLPPTGYYLSASPEADIENLGLLRPPILGVARGLDDSRMLDILMKIRREIPIDPVEVYRHPKTGEIVLANGAHRYFASVALCCSKIPCEYIDPPAI